MQDVRLNPGQDRRRRSFCSHLRPRIPPFRARAPGRAGRGARPAPSARPPPFRAWAPRRAAPCTACT